MATQGSLIVIVPQNLLPTSTQIYDSLFVKSTSIIPILVTLKVESFAGRNFRDFANFYGVRESVYPRNRTFIGVREILHEKSLKMASK